MTAVTPTITGTTGPTLRFVNPQAPAARHPLAERAALLWPDGEPYAEHNRRAWLRAVRVVRSTRRGWLVDRMVPRKEQDQ